QKEAGVQPTQAQYVQALRDAGHDHHMQTLRASAQRVMGEEAKTPGELARDWLTDPRHPDRLKLTPTQAMHEATEITHVSIGTWNRELSQLRRELPAEDQKVNGI